MPTEVTSDRSTCSQLTLQSEKRIIAVIVSCSKRHVSYCGSQLRQHQNNIISLKSFSLEVNLRGARWKCNRCGSLIYIGLKSQVCQVEANVMFIANLQELPVFVSRMP